MRRPPATRPPAEGPLALHLAGASHIEPLRAHVWRHPPPFQWGALLRRSSHPSLSLTTLPSRLAAPRSPLPLPLSLADLEWKLTYVGSAESEKYDQVLDTVFVGPVAPGQYRFVFQVGSPPGEGRRCGGGGGAVGGWLACGAGVRFVLYASDAVWR